MQDIQAYQQTANIQKPSNIQTTSKSSIFFEEAKKFIPGGVNSPVRAFKGVGGIPRFMASGEGSKVYDEDGNRYIDYLGAWGPLILGHKNPFVAEAIKDVVNNGWGFGTATAMEVELAKLVVSAFPSIEKIRFVNSGTEACMTALRLARGYTGKNMVLKFEGCYHGHADPFLVKAGSGLLTFGIPASSGVSALGVYETLVAPYNDVAAIMEIFKSHGEQLSSVIVEPVPGNMGVVLPDIHFLKTLEEQTRKYGALLIFDEVITGFRLTFGGAQTIYDIKPDLTCLGKIIGGGLPVGAVGGKARIMDKLAPEGEVYQAGTLSGNPLSMAAGIATLKYLKKDNPYEYLEQLGSKLETRVKEEAAQNSVNAVINRIGSMFTIFFSKNPIKNHADLATVKTNQYSKFFHALLEEGIYFPPSQFEAAFISTAHKEEDILFTINGISKGFQKVKCQGA